MVWSGKQLQLWSVAVIQRRGAERHEAENELEKRKVDWMWSLAQDKITLAIIRFWPSFGNYVKLMDVSEQ
ncbi:hypothetical protein ACOMHN_030558 [Nucella lapillus]